MSYNNFIPEVWSANIQRERERAVVAAKLCWRDFEGEIKGAGDTVRIQGVTRPTIKSYTKDSTSITPENLADSSTILKVDQAKYFAFEIDDIDKVQAKGSIMDAQMKEAAAALAEDMDDYIYNLYSGIGADMTVTQGSLTSANILSTVTAAAKKLWANNVPKNEEIYLEVSPQVYEKMLLARIIRDTDNTGTLDNGYVGMLGGFKVFMSNGVKQSTTTSYCFARTKKAIALADQFTKMEPYRPESSFSDAVKGLHLYGAKIIRPKELVLLTVTTAAESSI